MLPWKQASLSSWVARPLNVAGLRILFHRHRFPGQDGLADEEILGGEQAQVGGNDRTGMEHDNIARHHFTQRDVGLLAVPQQGGMGLHAFAQRLNRLGGTPV